MVCNLMSSEDEALLSIINNRRYGNSMPGDICVINDRTEQNR